jgi:hypothetical protein
VIVEVDVASNAGAQFVHVGEHVAVEVLVLTDRPERFRAAVVVTRTGLSHQSGDAQLCTECDDVVIGGLTAAIGVEHGADAREGPSACRVTQRLFDELGADVVLDPSAENSTTVFVTDRAEIGLTSADGHVGVVTRPDEIERTLIEAARHQVLGERRVGVGLRRHLEQRRTEP